MLFPEKACCSICYEQKTQPIEGKEVMKPSKSLTICVAAVLISAVFSAQICAQEMNKEAANGVTVDIGRPYYDADPTVIQDKMVVLDFKGGFSTLEGGRNYARAFGKAAFAHAVEDAEKSMKQALDLDKAEALEILRESEHLEVLKKFNAGFYQFLEGIALETEIPLEDVVLALNDGVYFAVGINAFRDKVLKKLGFIQQGCTVAGFDNGILGENNDNPVKYSGHNTLVKSSDDKIMILTMGSPLVMLMGMSENLAVVANTIDAFFAGHSIRDGGLPDAAIVINALLSYKTVDEVVENYRDTKMLVALALTFADKSGGLGTIEFNAKQFIGNIILRPGDGEHHIAHTNHPRFTKSYLLRTWFSDDEGKANRLLANTFWRLDFAEDFLSASATKNAQEVQQLFRTYPVLIPGSGGDDFRTTVSVVWDINNQTAHISPDRPDITEYEAIGW
jgi:hypothetical protein